MANHGGGTGNPTQAINLTVTLNASPNIEGLISRIIAVFEGSSQQTQSQIDALTATVENLTKKLQASNTSLQGTITKEN